MGEALKGLNSKVERSHSKTIQICYREKAMLICRNIEKQYKEEKEIEFEEKNSKFDFFLQFAI